MREWYVVPNSSVPQWVRDHYFNMMDEKRWKPWGTLSKTTGDIDKKVWVYAGGQANEVDETEPGTAHSKLLGVDVNTILSHSQDIRCI